MNQFPYKPFVTRERRPCGCKLNHSRVDRKSPIVSCFVKICEFHKREMDKQMASGGKVMIGIGKRIEA